MIETILNTYCEVEFLCKDNSPNWLGFFLFFIIYWLLVNYSLILELKVLKSSPEEFEKKHNENVFNVSIKFLIFFIVSLLLGSFI